MRSDVSALSLEPPASTFTFRSSGPRPRDPDVARFRSRLIQALTIGQGLRVPIRLSWNAGRPDSVSVGCDGGGGKTWLRQILFGCFGPGRWVPAFPEARESSRRHRVAQIPPGGGLPLPPLDGGGETWSEGVFRALPHLTRGQRVRWDLWPMAPRAHSHPRPPELEARPVPTGFRLAPLSRAERELRDEVDLRVRGARWWVTAELEETSDSADRARQLGVLVTALATSPAGAGLTWRSPLLRWLGAFAGFSLSTPEVAGLFPEPWSTAGAGTPINGSSFRIPLGTSSEGRTCCLELEPTEGRHLLILGETGMGKSSAAVALALTATRYASVVLFDPVGDTARRFIDGLPAELAARTLWVSPVHSPVPVNALSALSRTAGGPIPRERARQNLVSALRRVRAFRYEETPFWGPRIEEMLGRALVAGASYPGGTLIEAERLLSGVRERAPVGVPEEAVSLIQELRELAVERPEEVDGARRLLGEVTGNGLLRRMLCATGARWEPCVAPGEGRILVVSGDAPEVGETGARYLLAVHLALLWSALLARPAGPKTVLLLDEAQWYAHDAVAEALRLARRSNVHLWLVTQALASLAPSVREAVLTNTGDFLVFRGSPDDARELSRWRTDLTPEGFLALEKGEAIAFLGKGRTVATIRAIRPRHGEVGTSRREAVVRASAPWVLAPGVDDRAPPPDVGAGVALRELLLVLWASFEMEPLQEELTVPLDPLRTLFDPEGSVTRELGGLLHSAGAIRDRTRTSSGSAWVLLRHGVLNAVTPTPTETERETARTRWRWLEGELSRWRQHF